MSEAKSNIEGRVTPAGPFTMVELWALVLLMAAITAAIWVGVRVLHSGRLSFSSAAVLGVAFVAFGLRGASRWQLLNSLHRVVVSLLIFSGCVLAGASLVLAYMSTT